MTYLLTNSPPASGKGTLTELQTWAAQKPDIVLMHYGTNDVWRGVVSLDALITDAWASTNSTASSPIYIVDQWTGFDAAADTSDGVHPNFTGSQKMAAKAYAAVVSHGWF